MIRQTCWSLLIICFIEASKVYDPETCGLDGVGSIVNKVMGGKDAKMGEMPWNVHLMIESPDGLVAGCGGTMISRRHFVTAAHCFRIHGEPCSSSNMLQPSEIIKSTKLLIGGVCLEENASAGCTEEMIGVLRKVKRIEFYEKFFAENCAGLNDLALIEIDREVQSHHACLPHRGHFEFHAKKQLHSFGFGANPLKKKGGSVRLQTIKLGSAQNKEKCLKKWGIKNTEKYDAFICTKEKNTANVCEGDSGGGIMAHISHIDKDERQFVVGVISFGTSCEQLVKNKPGHGQMNVDLSYYAATIDKFLNDAQPIDLLEGLNGTRLDYTIDK